jgi:hypothetical protein
MKKSYKQKMITDPGGYTLLRKSEYPSIGEQLDALYKARNGDTSELETIDELITEIKEKYPKPE